LREVQENLATHDYSIGRFYLDRYNLHGGGLKGAQSRFKEVVEKYPCFSLMDDVLFRLAFTYQQQEEPDEAAKYYQQLLQNYPDSQYAAKAKDQLAIIGVAPPEKATPSPCARPEPKGFVGNLMQQVSGRADVTVAKDGILISRDKKDSPDLIDVALDHNGQLPSNVTPTAPSTVKQPKGSGNTPPPQPASQTSSQTPASSGTRP